MKQEEAEARRMQVKQRRIVDEQQREKLKYWHLIKRDVLRHKKSLAMKEANERIKQVRRMTKWLIQMRMRAYMTNFWISFVEKKKSHERLIR